MKFTGRKLHTHYRNLVVRTDADVIGYEIDRDDATITLRLSPDHEHVADELYMSANQARILIAALTDGIKEITGAES